MLAGIAFLVNVGQTGQFFAGVLFYDPFALCFCVDIFGNVSVSCVCRLVRHLARSVNLNRAFDWPLSYGVSIGYDVIVFQKERAMSGSECLVLIGFLVIESQFRILFNCIKQLPVLTNHCFVVFPYALI